MSDTFANTPERSEARSLAFKPILAQEPILTSVGRDWKHILVERYVQLPGEVEDAECGDHIITLHLGAPTELNQWLDGKHYNGRFGSGDLTYTPAGHHSRWQWNPACDVVYLRLTNSFLEHLAEEVEAGKPTFMPRFLEKDMQIEFIGQALLRELHLQQAGDRLHADSLANMLGIHLLRHHAETRHAVHSPAGSLAPTQLQQALDYVHAHLTENISLNDLAKAVHVSPSHFATQFKRSTGVSPHRYLMERRIERAVQLLEKGQHTIAEVVAQAGFYDQSHLTRSLRKALGVTPNQILKQSLAVQKNRYLVSPGLK